MQPPRGPQQTQSKKRTQPPEKRPQAHQNDAGRTVGQPAGTQRAAQPAQARRAAPPVQERRPAQAPPQPRQSQSRPSAQQGRGAPPPQLNRPVQQNRPAPPAQPAGKATQRDQGNQPAQAAPRPPQPDAAAAARQSPSVAHNTGPQSSPSRTSGKERGGKAPAKRRPHSNPTRMPPPKQLGWLRRPQKIRPIYLATAVVLLMLFVFYMGNNISRQKALKGELQEVKQTLQETLELLDEKERQLEFSNTNEYIEQQARERFGYIMPGDIRFVPEEMEADAPPIPGVQAPEVIAGEGGIP